jgi:anti-sigma regulatory factor (Ser/Thr protein kinase)
MALPADPTSVRLARSYVSGVAASFLDVESTAVAALLVSELATNAVLHARTDFTVSVVLQDERLRVIVEDAHHSAPMVQSPAISSASGRGLFLVDALATRWGVEPTERGKAVWFELGRVREAPGGQP